MACVPVVYVACDAQDSTDLMKCLEYLTQSEQRKDKQQQEEDTETIVVALGAIGGRLDHEFANINALYLYPQFRVRERERERERQRHAEIHPSPLCVDMFKTRTLSGLLLGMFSHTLPLSLSLSVPSQCFLLGDVSLGILLPPGENFIQVDSSREGPKCGLIPIAGPTIASSRGLRWEVDETRME